jgi:cell wall-associated NlpC family hydrolase
MIFAARRAFIDIDYVYNILRDDGYRLVDSDEVVPGDVVLYKQGDEPSHVALVIATGRIGNVLSVRVISKWGLDAEFEHFMENVPAQLGVPSEFYSERQL